MNSDIILNVENVSKKLCKSLKRNMLYGINDVVRNTIGLKQKSNYLRQSEFWAVKDISFQLKKGDALGILGNNGAGKTTLMRLLTGIYPIDSGTITVDGKISPLFALAVGMNPMFTGRENIYVKGTLLGMSSNEINQEIDNIIEFSELQEFIDSPFGIYSSGMRARLGFSIAVASNPSLLIIDEGLSVGDIAFRNKCYDKLDELKNEIAIITISHNVNRISRIANRLMIMDKGMICHQTNDVDDGIHYYLQKWNVPSVENMKNFSVFDKNHTQLNPSNKLSTPQNIKISNNAKLISLHIPKTAGTSFRNILKYVYGDSKVARFDILDKSKNINVDEQRLVLPKLSKHISVIHGHFLFSDLKKKLVIKENTPIITWLRDPASRVISNYFYLDKQLKEIVLSEKFPRTNMLKRMKKTLLEFANMEGNRNRQYKHLQGIALTEFTFVGITEHFSDDLNDLAKTLNWNNVIEYKHNITAAKKPIISEEEIAEIKSLNRLDYQLYEEALALRNKRKGKTNE